MTGKSLNINTDEKIWEDLLPGRKDFAEEIIDLIEKQYFEKKDKQFKPYGEHKSTILAINAEYGMGKTVFAHALNNYIDDSIYFSVWKKDYIENPLIAIAQELVTAEETWREALGKVVLSFIKNTNISLPGATIKTSGIIEDLFPKKDALSEFKIVLEKLVYEKGHLVIIVDELDRCRPDYAVKVLETIKHFFDIKGLTFILPINQLFLEKSIEGFYNLDSDTFNGKEHYLNRFFSDYKELKNINVYEYLSSKIGSKMYLDRFQVNFWNNVAKDMSLREINKYTKLLKFKNVDLFIKKRVPIFKDIKNFLKGNIENNNTSLFYSFNRYIEYKGFIKINNKIDEEYISMDTISMILTYNTENQKYTYSNSDFNIKLYRKLYENINEFEYSDGPMSELVEYQILGKMNYKDSNNKSNVAREIREIMNITSSTIYDELNTPEDIVKLKEILL